MTTSASQLYDNIHAFVEESKRYLDEGNDVQLNGLDEKIGELCKRIIALPPAEAKFFAERLRQLLEEVSDLGERLVKQREALQQELSALNLHQKANVAYKTSDMMVPASPQKKEE